VTQPILVAGAGPAGLALALQAHAHGARVRIIDRRPDAVRPSRALILHARTLEVLRPLGVTQALADRFRRGRLFLAGEAARLAAIVPAVQAARGHASRGRLRASE
jgi:2-polyprenyl-6-methoxyphenol hydroxylase-like FAD-dependent oxidoreductase